MMNVLKIKSRILKERMFKNNVKNYAESFSSLELDRAISWFESKLEKLKDEKNKKHYSRMLRQLVILYECRILMNVLPIKN